MNKRYKLSDVQRLLSKTSPFEMKINLAKVLVILSLNNFILSSIGKRELEYRWKPEAQHQCNIPRLTEEELILRFGKSGLPSLYPHPIIIRRGIKGKNKEFFNMTSQERIVQSLPRGIKVTLSSSNSFSERRRTIP
jgi:hypothetical protein